MKIRRIIGKFGLFLKDSKFYSLNKGQEANYKGMLGGLQEIHEKDIEFSQKILEFLLKNQIIQGGRALGIFI